jgi:hypothetical protein
VREGPEAAGGGNRKGERSLEAAKRVHEAKVKKIEKDRAALDKRSQAEAARWKSKKRNLRTL